MADDVGQALLRDPVDHELLLGLQLELALERALDVDAGLLGRRRRKRQQRALKAELVERFGPQAASDQPDVLGAAASRLPQLLEIAAKLLRPAPGDRLAPQHQPGKGLADLVVELARDAPALRLLSRQRAQRALAALALEPIEHLVERLRQRDDLLVAVAAVDPLARRERVDPAHQSRQPLQRRQRAPEQREIHHQRDREPHEQHGNLGQRSRHRDRDRGETRTATARPSTPAYPPNSLQNRLVRGRDDRRTRSIHAPRRPSVEAHDPHRSIVAHASPLCGRNGDHYPFLPSALRASFARIDVSMPALPRVFHRVPCVRGRRGGRTRAWLRRAELDRRLAEGPTRRRTRCGAPRARQLTSRRYRRGLAGGLRRLVAEAGDQRRVGRPPGPPIDRLGVQDAREPLLPSRAG